MARRQAGGGITGDPWTYQLRDLNKRVNKMTKSMTSLVKVAEYKRTVDRLTHRLSIMAEIQKDLTDRLELAEKRLVLILRIQAATVSPEMGGEAERENELVDLTAEEEKKRRDWDPPPGPPNTQ